VANPNTTLTLTVTLIRGLILDDAVFASCTDKAAFFHFNLLISMDRVNNSRDPKLTKLVLQSNHYRTVR